MTLPMARMNGPTSPDETAVDTVTGSVTSSQIVALAMERLRGFYGDGIPDPIDYKITRWHSNPFSLGSYSYFALATELGDRAILAEPVGNKVLFAGEATIDRAFAQVPGAYLTGLREADRIIGW